MRSSFSLIALLLMLAQVSALAQIAPVPQRMNFQGRLARPDGTPVADGNVNLQFSLYDALTGGTLLWQRSLTTIPVRKGVFSARLDFSSGYQNGATYSSLFGASALFLEISVNGGTPLTPRQPFLSVAYAIKADSVKDGSITTNSLAANAVTSAKILDGTITANKFASGIFNPIAWLLGGNSGVTSGFIGTTDNQPLVFKVNGRQAMRYSYAENTAHAGFEYRSINVLGGSEINSIGLGVVGATIAGGGEDDFTLTDLPNRVTADFGTVSGGAGNTASGNSATVAGGGGNIASGELTTVGGGFGNIASNGVSTVSGGLRNTASGLRATVPGGDSNTAAGVDSFAAGFRAKANHDGTFVWADSQFADFASTAAKQFLIRAAGGVGIGTPSPVGALHIKGLRGVLNLEGTTEHVYIQFYPRGVSQGRKAYIGFPTAGSHDLNIANEDGGAVRVIGTFINNSDGRWKTNITPLDNALNSILNLRGVSYDWRKDIPGQHFTEQRQIGFLAQEVERVLPELVYTDTEGYKYVAYLNVVPVIVEAMKQQQKQMETLKKNNDTLRAELTALKAAVEELKTSHK